MGEQVIEEEFSTFMGIMLQQIYIISYRQAIKKNLFTRTGVQSYVMLRYDTHNDSQVRATFQMPSRATLKFSGSTSEFLRRPYSSDVKPALTATHWRASHPACLMYIYIYIYPIPNCLQIVCIIQPLSLRLRVVSCSDDVRHHSHP